MLIENLALGQTHFRKTNNYSYSRLLYFTVRIQWNRLRAAFCRILLFNGNLLFIYQSFLFKHSVLNNNRELVQYFNCFILISLFSTIFFSSLCFDVEFALHLFIFRMKWFIFSIFSSLSFSLCLLLSQSDRRKSLQI